MYLLGEEDGDIRMETEASGQIGMEEVNIGGPIKQGLWCHG